MTDSVIYIQAEMIVILKKLVNLLEKSESDLLECIRNLQSDLGDAMSGDLEYDANFMKNAPRTYVVLKRIMDMEIPE